MGAPKAFRWAMGSGVKETTYGVAQADASMVEWLAVTEADFAELEIAYRSNEDEINGFVGATEHQEESRKGTVARKIQASVESIAFFVNMMLGNITTTGTTPNFTHSTKWRSVCSINPPSFSFVEGIVCAGLTGTYWLYKGSVVEQVSVEVNGKGFVELSVTVKTDGSETAKVAYVFPTTVLAVNKLVGAMLTLKCGATGAEDLTSLVRTFKFTLNSGIVEPPSIGNVNVVEYQYGGNNPTLEVEFSFKGDKAHAIYAAQAAKTNQVLDALLQFNANRSVRLFCTQGIVNAGVKPSNNETQLTVKYMAEHNTTDSGAGVFTFKTGVASYLVAA